MTIIEQLHALVVAAREEARAGQLHPLQNDLAGALSDLPPDWEQQLRAVEADTRERCAVEAESFASFESAGGLFFPQAIADAIRGSK